MTLRDFQYTSRLAQNSNILETRRCVSSGLEAGVRIVRVPVFHEATFRTLLAAVCRAQRCLPYGGQCWEAIEEGRGFGLYRPAPFTLSWVQERVELYEFHLYHRLMHEHCGRDGVLRPHTHLVQGPSGAYRASIAVSPAEVVGAWRAE